MEFELQDISKQIQRIARTRKGDMFPVMSGKVVVGSVDAENGVCSVVLTGGNTEGETDGAASVEVEGVLLSSVSLNSNGVLCYPADNSDVLVAEIDGPGQYAIIKCSTLVKHILKIGATKVTVTDGHVNTEVGSNTKFSVEDGTVKAQVGSTTKLTMSNSGYKIEAGGQELGAVLKEILINILSMTVTTKDGPSGTPLNFVAFQNDYTKLTEIFV